MKPGNREADLQLENAGEAVALRDVLESAKDQLSDDARALLGVLDVICESIDNSGPAFVAVGFEMVCTGGDDMIEVLLDVADGPDEHSALQAKQLLASFAETVFVEAARN